MPAPSVQRVLPLRQVQVSVYVKLATFATVVVASSVQQALTRRQVQVIAQTALQEGFRWQMLNRALNVPLTRILKEVQRPARPALAY